MHKDKAMPKKEASRGSPLVFAMRNGGHPGPPPHPIPLPARGEGDEFALRQARSGSTGRLLFPSPRRGEDGRRPDEGVRAVVFSEESPKKAPTRSRRPTLTTAIRTAVVLLLTNLAAVAAQPMDKAAGSLFREGFDAAWLLERGWYGGERFTISGADAQ